MKNGIRNVFLGEVRLLYAVCAFSSFFQKKRLLRIPVSLFFPISWRSKALSLFISSYIYIYTCNPAISELLEIVHASDLLHRLRLSFKPISIVPMIQI